MADATSYTQEVKCRNAKCVLCSRLNSAGGSEVRHHHVSSQWTREVEEEVEKDTFICLLCKELEPTKFASRRRKLILTRSTLYSVWIAHDFRAPFHMDMETIVGGQFRDMTRVLKSM